MFSREFARFFGTPILHLITVYYAKKGVLKNPTKFTVKFMGAAASGISENKPCLAGCKVIDVLQN